MDKVYVLTKKYNMETKVICVYFDYAQAIEECDELNNVSEAVYEISTVNIINKKE